MTAITFFSVASGGGGIENIRQSFLCETPEEFIYKHIPGLQFANTAPLIVLGTVPLGIAGSLSFLRLTGSSLNLVSIMGILMSIGIVTSNSIILVNRILERRRGGENLEDAIRQGSRERVRPILITTIVTIFAMVPISFVWGTGSENSVPMARAIIGGLLLSTPITLFLTPILFRMAFRKEMRMPWEVR